MKKICNVCGQPFEAEKDWMTTCKPCYAKQKQAEQEATLGYNSEDAKLRVSALNQANLAYQGIKTTPKEMLIVAEIFEEWIKTGKTPNEQVEEQRVAK